MKFSYRLGLALAAFLLFLSFKLRRKIADIYSAYFIYRSKWTQLFPYVGEVTTQDGFVKGLFNLSLEVEKKHNGLGIVKLFNRPFLLVSNPQHAKAVLNHSSRHVKSGAMIQNATRAFVGEKTLFALEGPQWQYERLIAKTILHRALTLKNPKAMEEVAVNLIAKLKNTIKTESVVDIHSWCLRYHLSMVGKTVLGDDLGFFNKQAKGDEIVEAFEFLLQQQVVVSKFNPESEAWLLHRENARKTVRGIVQDRFTQYQRHLPPPPDCVLSELFALLEKDVNMIETITEYVLQLFSAGFNTVAVECSFIIFYLCKNPVYWNAVRLEVEGFFEKQGVDEILHSKNLPLLNAIRMETLRLVPPTAYTARTLETDLHLNTGCIPQGTDILIPIVYIQTSAQNWGSNASEFYPQRWLNHDNNPSFLAFGDGSRNCVGSSFAKKESLTLMAMLIEVFAFALPVGSRQLPTWTGYGIRPFDTVQQKIALHVQVTRRVKPKTVSYTMARINKQ